MAALKKFLFDRDFDAPSEEPEESAILEDAPAAPPEPTFTAADLQAAREQGVREGHEQALREAQASLQRMSTLALAGIAAGMRDGIEAFKASLDQRHRDTVALTVAALRKLHPQLSRQGAAEEIAAVLGECMAQLDGAPRVTLRVNPGLVEVIQQNVEETAARAEFQGKLNVAGDARLPVGNCRVEWDDGGAERDEGRMWAEIDAALVRAVGEEGLRRSFAPE